MAPHTNATPFGTLDVQHLSTTHKLSSDTTKRPSTTSFFSPRRAPWVPSRLSMWLRRFRRGLLWTVVAVMRDAWPPFVFTILGAVAWTYGSQHWAWLHNHPASWLVTVWLSAEALFWAYIKVKTRQIQNSFKTPFMTPADRAVLFERCLRSVPPEGYEPFVSGWFKNAPFSEIYRGNMEQWVSWALFDERLRRLNALEYNELTGYVDAMERQLGRPLPSGYNKNVRSMRLMFDPVEVHQRPMLFYVIVAGIRIAHELYLTRQGFSRCRAGPITYWFRPAMSDCADKTPIVFAHGLGIGLAQYYHLIKRLTTLDCAIFLTEINNVSCRLEEEAIVCETAVPAMCVMIKQHGYNEATWMGHSYGSVHVAWMLRNCPEVVAKAILLDPIVFLLNYSSVCYNFVYRKPESVVEMGINYFAAREIFISKAMSRHFHWMQNILWSEDITVPTLVVLSQRDSIIDAHVVRSYFEAAQSHHVDLVWLEGLGHADFLFIPSLLDRLFDRIKGLHSKKM